jgi:hypothetical protein
MPAMALVSWQYDGLGRAVRRSLPGQPDHFCYGRFLEMDPAGLAGDSNLYGFCGNNPAQRSDPLGLDSSDGPGDSDSGATGGETPGSTLGAVTVTGTAQGPTTGTTSVGPNPVNYTVPTVYNGGPAPYNNLPLTSNQNGELTYSDETATVTFGPMTEVTAYSPPTSGIAGQAYQAMSLIGRDTAPIVRALEEYVYPALTDVVLGLLALEGGVPDSFAIEGGLPGPIAESGLCR